MENEGIRVRRVEQCFLCGADGAPLYTDMRDRLFGAPGVWNISKCENPGCALLWLDPQPLPEDTGKLYVGSYYTHQAPVLSTLKRLSRSLKMSRFGTLIWSAMYHQWASRGSLLEVGCGSGLYLSEMRSLGWDVQGIDFDEAAVKTAASYFGLNVSCASLEAAGFKKDSFDAITANHVVEHIHDPLSLLKECWRILKPGGSLVITCPNAKSLAHGIFKDACYHLDPPRHLYSFSRSNLSALAQKAGFRVSSARSTINSARHIHVTSRRIRETGFSPIEYRPSKWKRFAALMFMLLEGSAVIVNKDAGEELVLVAMKD
ncbi:MAG: class I SAM-dependent methyltransferase [Deltaproteobacteria bacterium]|nr:class I SAM-dependent methyltransferase [Deltaproteobacteria bacterium]